MKEMTIRDFCGDYALDIPFGDDSTIVLYFNSFQNALNVKRIIEVDESVPNAATVCDMVEVVRCRDCKHSLFIRSCSKYECKKGCGALKYATDFCSYGERKDGDG